MEERPQPHRDTVWPYAVPDFDDVCLQNFHAVFAYQVIVCLFPWCVTQQSGHGCCSADLYFHVYLVLADIVVKDVCAGRNYQNTLAIIHNIGNNCDTFFDLILAD